jgi:hypothetical protein
MAITQWVNLEKEDAYAADSDIGSKDRCGKLTIKTLYATKNVALAVKYKLSPSGTANLTYNAAERIRNPNFKGTTGLSDTVTEVEVHLNDEFQLPAAGGNKYKVEAKDANNVVVQSTEVQVKRKLYYQFMHMEDAVDVTKKVTPYALTQLETHCTQYEIVLTKAGVDKKIPFHKCINSGAGGRFTHVGFAADVASKYDLSVPQKKVGCVTVLSNYIGTFKKIPVSITHVIGGVANPRCSVSSGVATLQVLMGLDFLWHGLDDEDDIAKRWFVRGAVKYTPLPPPPIPPATPAPAASGTATVAPPPPSPQTVALTAANLEIGGTKLRTYGGHQMLTLTLGPTLLPLFSHPSGTLEIVLDINQVAGFSGGFSWGGGGFALTTCCTKAWFEDKLQSKSSVIWNHELGHRMGMVAFGNKTTISGSRKLPDGPPTLYGENRGVNDKGHQGPHCEKGATYTAATNTWTGTPGCVLFGATAIGSTDSPLDYCSECTPIAKKLDLHF